MADKVPLIDPFDDPNFARQSNGGPPSAATPTKAPYRTDIIDPFDDPNSDAFRGARPPIPPKPPIQPGTLPGWGMALAQGATFGFGDELIAGARSKFSNTPYDQALKEERVAYDEFQKEHPYASIGLEVAGSLPLSLVSGGAAALGTAGRATSLGSKVVRGAGVGAAEGALAGAGNADGDLMDRAKGAGVGGLLGAGLGGAVPAVVAGSSAAGRAVTDFTGNNPRETAERKILQAMRQDGDTPNTYITRDIADGGGYKPEIMADFVPGSNVADLTEVLSHRPGPTKARAHKMMQERSQSQSERVLNDLDSTLGGRRDFYASMDELIRTRREKSADAYTTAYAHGPVDSPDIQSILKRLPPKVFAEAKEQLQLSGRDMPQAFVKDADGNITLNTQVIPDVEFLDHIKRGIDNVIEQNSEFGKVNSKGREYALIKNELVEKLDELVPAYKNAREQYAGPTALMNAMETGRNLFNMKWQEIRHDVGKMSGSEKDAFLTGISDIVMKRIDDVADGRDATRSIWGNDTKRKQIQEAIKAVEPDEDQAAILMDKLEKRMGRERNMAHTKNRLTGGSATAGRLEAGRLLDNVGIEAATGFTGIPTAGRVLGGLLGNQPQGAKDAINQSLGDILLSRSGQIAPEMERMKLNQRAAERQSRQLGLLANTMGGVYAQAAGRYAPGLLNIPDEDY